MNFLGMGPMELMLILVLALIVVGPGKLPEMAGQVGKVIREFRRTTSELSGEFSRTLSLEVEERKAAQTVAQPGYTEAAPPPPPEPAYVASEPAPAATTYEGSAPVAAEPSEAPAPSPSVASVPGKRTYDPDLAPPY